MKWSWLKHPVAVAALGSLVATLVMWIFDLLPILLSWVNGFAVALYDWFASDHALPGWLWLLFGLFATIGLYVVVAYVVSVMKQAAPDAHESFTELHYRNVMWRWHWVGRRIQRIMPHCSSCDRPLVWTRVERGIISMATLLVCEGYPPEGESQFRGVRGKIIVDFDGEVPVDVVNSVEREIIYQANQLEKSA